MYKRQAIDLLKANTSKEQFISPTYLAQLIKKLPVKITGVSPLDEAISTSGGIALSSIDKNLMLRSIPNHYTIGEMLDWDTRTGGYLLQACFSMGHYLSKYLNKTP